MTDAESLAWARSIAAAKYDGSLDAMLNAEAVSKAARRKIAQGLVDERQQVANARRREARARMKRGDGTHNQSATITIQSSTTTIALNGVGRLFVEELLRAMSSCDRYHQALSCSVAVNGAPVVSMMVLGSSIEQRREPNKRGML